jgi:hypothetical protein
MQQKIIAEIAGVNQADVANHIAIRTRYVSTEKARAIQKVLDMPKAEAALWWLKQGRTLTPLQSLNLFGLHSLSQQVTKWRARRIDVRNIVPGSEKYQTYAVYALFINGEQATGDQK